MKECIGCRKPISNNKKNGKCYACSIKEEEE